MKAIKFLLTLVVTFGLFIGNAVADTSFSTGSYSVTGLGDQLNSGYDKFSITGLSGSVDTFPSTATIGTYSFEVGINCGGLPCLAPSGTTDTFDMTMGSQTHTILFPWSLDISYADTLTITSNAPPMTFWNVGGENVTVTGLVFGPLNIYQSGTLSGDVHASFVSTPVPEPETYAMMLAGLGLLGFMARRRKQKEGAA